jgi:cation diffusion facilitator family transporter
VLTSIGVLAGLALVWLTGLGWLDAAVAAVIAVHIIRMGAGVYSQGLHGLMDTRLPAAEEAAIRAILDEHHNEIVEYHALRARKAGSARFIDLHLVLHRILTVGQAHALCDHLEEHIGAALPGSDITIHVEPCGPDCPRCGP